MTMMMMMTTTTTRTQQLLLHAKALSLFFSTSRVLLLLLAASSSVCAAASVSASSSFALTHDMVKLSYSASILSHGLNAMDDGDDELLRAILQDEYGFIDNPLLIYTDEPDKAVVARKDGYCFAVFRGTTPDYNDWQQNFDWDLSAKICSNHSSNAEDAEGDCCVSRQGFTRAYLETSFRPQMTADLIQCVQEYCNIDNNNNTTTGNNNDNTTSNNEQQHDCVVLAGHSQGGAIATLAFIDLSYLNPLLITFGQPPTLDADADNDGNENCNNLMDVHRQDRYYRYINTLSEDGFNGGLGYDPIPFVGTNGADHYGHIFVLGEDDSNVAHFAYDNNNNAPNPDWWQYSWNVEAINIFTYTLDVHGTYDYMERLNNLLLTNEHIIGTNGWSTPHYCLTNAECATKHCRRVNQWVLQANQCTGDENGPCNDHEDCRPPTDDTATTTTTTPLICVDYHCRAIGPNAGDYCASNDDCNSGRCDASSQKCAPKLGSCAPCNHHSDCRSGFCPHGACANPATKKVENGCACWRDYHCESRRCDGLVGTPKCLARVGYGQPCGEHSDCISNSCSKWSWRRMWWQCN